MLQPSRRRPTFKEKILWAVGIHTHWGISWLTRRLFASQKFFCAITCVGEKFYKITTEQPKFFSSLFKVLFWKVPCVGVFVGFITLKEICCILNATLVMSKTKLLYRNVLITANVCWHALTRYKEVRPVPWWVAINMADWLAVLLQRYPTSGFTLLLTPRSFMSCLTILTSMWTRWRSGVTFDCSERVEVLIEMSESYVPYILHRTLMKQDSVEMPSSAISKKRIYWSHIRVSVHIAYVQLTWFKSFVTVSSSSSF